MYDTIRHFFEACYPFGYPLLTCSVVLLAAVLYHLIFVSRPQAKATAALAAGHGHGELADIAREAQDDGNEAATEARLALYADQGRAGLTLISIITDIAPMLGILGTAWGLVEIFGVFGAPDAQEGIALGISKALYTTIFGLAIAVPGMIARTCFERALERRAARLNELFTAILARRKAQ
ncbi:MAG: MotA/TolQ/ExbB proton channel family protein [Akkermansia sp.]|nr:MotA/TolQ/ExbB proton channel family protein [Akkermansia sp.]